MRAALSRIIAITLAFALTACASVEPSSHDSQASLEPRAPEYTVVSDEVLDAPGEAWGEPDRSPLESSRDGRELMESDRSINPAASLFPNIGPEDVLFDSESLLEYYHPNIPHIPWARPMYEAQLCPDE